MNLEELTPVEKVGNLYLKREDYFVFNDCNGSKVRGALYIIQEAVKKGYSSFVSVGSRFSPQCEIISNICEALNLKCYLFMPNAFKDTSVIQNIKNNKNTILIRELKQGAYTNVLISRARKYAQEHNYYFIEFGMDMPETIDIIKKQVKNIPKEVKRIVIPVGSGINFCAVLNGLKEYRRDDIQVVGVRVGRNPMPTINRYFPFFTYTQHKLIESPHSYEEVLHKKIENIELDPIYEAKCADYLEDGDLFWIVGHRKFN